MKVPQYLYADNEEMQRVVSLLLQQCQSDLSDNGWQVPELTQAEVNVITNSTFKPVMRRGTFWFNSSVAPNGKMQFITVKAIPAEINAGVGVNAIYETITSA